MRTQPQRFETRQSMKRQSFEVFHYRDPRVREVAMHHHDFYELYYFLGDSVEYRVEERVYALARGDLLLINPQELHQPLVAGDRPYERIVLWINKAYLQSFSTDETQLNRCFDAASHTNLLRPSARQQAAITAWLDEMIRESYGDGFGAGLCAESSFLRLMVELNRLSLKSGRMPEHEGSPLISGVLGHIGAHYREPLTLEALAQRFYVSKYHLSHEFRRTVGTGVYRYIVLKRLLTARRMLEEGQPPGTVCQSCGFGDYANFYRAFYAEYGLSPRAYRQDMLRGVEPARPETGQSDACPGRAAKV